MHHVSLLLILLATAAAGCGKKEAAGFRGGGPVPVVTALVEKRSVPVRLQAVGTVEPISTADIRPQVGGMLVSAAFTEGQEVRKGDVLFRIDERPYVAARDQARAALARDQAQALAARREVTRTRGLAKDAVASQSELEKATASADAAAAAVKADEAALRAAELSLQWCTIRAPFDGRTGAILIKPGNVVVANTMSLSATPLVTIHKLRPILVSFPVPEGRLPELRARLEDSKVQVEAVPQGDPGPALAGVVTFLSNQVDRTTGTVVVKASFPNDDGRLWPGQFVRVSAVVGRLESAAVVPNAALQEGQQGSYLFVIGANQAADLRWVRTGASDEGWTVVEGDAVQPGNRVVVDGQSRLVPGSVTQERAGASDKPSSPPVHEGAKRVAR